MALSNLDPRRLLYTGAGIVQWTPKAVSFTASASNNYDCTGGAGVATIVTWPSGTAGDEIRVRRSGVGAVIVVAGITANKIIGSMTINGRTVRAAALAPGSDVLFRKIAAGWTVDETQVALVDSTNLIQFITPQIGVIQSAGAVSDWYDQSGNSNDFSQTTAGAKPTYSATGAGNHPAVTFDGSDYVDAVDGAQWNVTTFTWVSCFKISNRTSANILNHNVSSVGWAISHSGVTSGKCNVTLQATNHTDTGSPFGENFHIFSVQHSATINEVRFALDGYSNSAVSSSQSIGDPSTPLRLGANGAGAAAFNGVYGGHILWSSVADLRSQSNAERWLRWTSVE